MNVERFKQEQTIPGYSAAVVWGFDWTPAPPLEQIIKAVLADNEKVRASVMRNNALLANWGKSKR